MFRARVTRDFASEEISFYQERPLQRIVGKLRRLLPEPRNPNDTWLDLNCHIAYYGMGYERGDLPLIVRIAEWLERELPGCDLWYGHDVGDATVWRFGPAERANILQYFNEVGHTPYEAGFRR